MKLALKPPFIGTLPRSRKSAWLAHDVSIRQNGPTCSPATVGAGEQVGPFCRIETSWANQADFRLRGSVPIKGGFNASFIYRNLPGAEQSALLTVQTADIATGRVRFLNPARTTLTNARAVNLYAPNSVFGPRFSQLDVAVRKTFSVGASRLQAAF